MLDLRLPIGLFFLLVGVILILTGAISHDTQRVGIPVDMDWGIFLFVFGALMTFFGYRGNAQVDDEPSDAAAGAPNTPDHSANQNI